VTLSITARCPRTGQVGAAVSSFDVGWTFFPAYDDAGQTRFLSLASAAAGAATGQANTRPGFPSKVLALLREGMEAQAALDAALAEEAEDIRDRFQVAVVDAAGRVAAFTGGQPQEWRGHRVGDGYVAAGNILAGEPVVTAMGDAFDEHADLPLDERLLTALEAGVTAGGDQRGQRSGLIRVATGEYVADLEIRIHDHSEPLAELRRLLGVYHEENDIIRLAAKVAPIMDSSFSEAELEELSDLGTHEAVAAARDMLVERDGSAESVNDVDLLLAALLSRPETASMRFGDALKALTAATQPS